MLEQSATEMGARSMEYLLRSAKVRVVCMRHGCEGVAQSGSRFPCEFFVRHDDDHGHSVRYDAATEEVEVLGWVCGRCGKTVDELPYSDLCETCWVREKHRQAWQTIVNNDNFRRRFGDGEVFDRILQREQS